MQDCYLYSSVTEKQIINGQELEFNYLLNERIINENYSSSKINYGWWSGWVSNTIIYISYIVYIFHCIEIYKFDVQYS